MSLAAVHGVLRIRVKFGKGITLYRAGKAPAAARHKLGRLIKASSAL